LKILKNVDLLSSHEVLSSTPNTNIMFWITKLNQQLVGIQTSSSSNYHVSKMPPMYSIFLAELILLSLSELHVLIFNSDCHSSQVDKFQSFAIYKVCKDLKNIQGHNLVA